jgi:hypothetical protein
MICTPQKAGMAWPAGEQCGSLAAINAGTCDRSRISNADGTAPAAFVSLATGE